jgi:IS5 family transposase
MERELTNNLSFMNFLGFPETIPDSSTLIFYDIFSQIRRYKEFRLE